MGAAEINLLDSEEQVLSAAEALLKTDTLGTGTAAFADLTRQYARLLRHVRYLIKVSDRMQIELNHLNNRLRASEQKYRSLFENVSEGIFIAQLDGQFLDVNPAMARILGCPTPGQFMQAHEEDILWPFLDNDERDRFLGTLSEHGAVTHLQLRMRRWDGVTIWVEINAHASAEVRDPGVAVEGMLFDITERKRMLEELRYLATTDGLTGLYNRRHFLELCERELLRSRRYRLKVGLLMLDADHFKTINDQHGHSVGDEVLRLIARLCRTQLREADIIGRLGGEEFAALLPQTGWPAAREAGERLNTAIAQTALPLGNGHMLHFTVSIGVCVFAAQNVTPEGLLKAADQALYAAKREGRNRVVSYSPELEMPGE